MSLSLIKKELKNAADPFQVSILQRFFKTARGEYGEGDIFLGIKVPVQRKIASKYLDLDLLAVNELLKSKFHEFRLCGLIILTLQYKKADDQFKQRIFNFYLKNTANINNWDLVDLSAPQIVGAHLLKRDRKIIYKLAGSKSLWEKRIAIVSTYAFIRNSDLVDTFLICDKLMGDKHDLIHKACGWMLREAGKRDLPALTGYLKKNAEHMPRTMLRYSIEKFPESARQEFLKIKRNLS